jgi:hypothetical protein
MIRKVHEHVEHLAAERKPRTWRILKNFASEVLREDKWSAMSRKKRGTYGKPISPEVWTNLKKSIPAKVKKGGSNLSMNSPVTSASNYTTDSSTNHRSKDQK